MWLVTVIDQGFVKLLQITYQLIEKVIPRKWDKLYVKWKGYQNSYNSWIDRKDIVL